MNDFIKENRWFLIISLSFLAVVLILAIIIPYGNEICALNQFRFEPLNSVFNFWTKLGEEKVWVLAMIGLAVFKNYRAALIALLVGGIVMAASFMSKEILQTERPARFFANQNRTSEVVFVPNIDIYMGNTSFPSGHTMSAFAFWGMMAFVSRRRVWVDVICALMACGVGFSRIFLCNHFLIDVGAGGALGLLIFLAFWQISHNKKLFSAPVFYRNLLGK